MNGGALSKARLENMHDVLAGYVDRAELPGLVSFVSRRGETHVDAIGTKAIGGHEPMGRDTIFRNASSGSTIPSTRCSPSSRTVGF